MSGKKRVGRLVRMVGVGTCDAFLLGFVIKKKLFSFFAGKINTFFLFLSFVM